MRSATRLTVDAPRAARIAFLAEDYAHLFADPADFKALLARLTMLHGKQTIARWHALIDAHDLPTLFAELIDQHYDPAYRRSSPDHLLAGEDTLAISLNPQESLAELAAQLVRQYGG
jgi:tRNA 2-selenouridine synthase